MTELQVAYDELKSSSEKELSDLRVRVSSPSPSTSKGKCEVSKAGQSLMFCLWVQTNLYLCVQQKPTCVCVRNMLLSKVCASVEFHIPPSRWVRSGGAGWRTVHLPPRGAPEAEGGGAGEAAAAGGESHTRDGASPRALPAAGRRERGALRHRALHAAAATAGGRGHPDPRQVMMTRWHLMCPHLEKMFHSG